MFLKMITSDLMFWGKRRSLGDLNSPLPIFELYKYGLQRFTLNLLPTFLESRQLLGVWLYGSRERLCNFHIQFNIRD